MEPTKTSFLVDHPDVDPADLEEYERVLALRFTEDPPSDKTQKLLEEMYDKVFKKPSPRLHVKLVKLIHETAEVSDRLSHDSEDKYARCTEALLEALAYIQ
jgi:hypothetical protein